MILGKIVGTTSTNKFKFSIDSSADKFEYVQVLDRNDNYVLCQIVEIEKDHGKGVAYCNIIGYRDKADRLRGLKMPFEPGADVLYAEDKFVKKTLGLEKSRNAAFIGTLEGRDKVEVFLDLNKLLTRHVAVLAKTGAGKCVNPKTKITLNDGSRVKIGNFVDKHLKYGFKRSKDVEFIENNDPKLKVVCLGEDHKVKFSRIKAFMRRKAPKVMYSMVTKSGQEIELTPDHPVPVMRDEGIAWIPVSKLAKNDYVLLPKVQIKGSKQKIDLIGIWRDSNKVRVDDKKVIQLIKSKIKEKNIDFKCLSKKLNFSVNAVRNWFKYHGIPLKQLVLLSKILRVDFDELKKHISSLRRVQKTLPSIIEVSEDFAKLFGYMLAEGHNNGKTISFTNFSKNIQEDYSRLVKKVFKIETSTILRENVLMIYNFFLAKSLEKIGFTNSSWTKFVPEEIIKSEKPVLYAFLSSFIDCDGHVCKNSPAVEICLANGPLVNDLEFILIRLGIIARHHKKIINNKKYGKLSINGASYLSQIYQKTSFLIKHKRQRLKEYSNLNSNTNVNIVPNINLVIRQLMDLLRMSYSMAGITSINMYVNYKGNPSFGSLSALLESFEARYKELEDAITEIKSLYVSMPCIDENYVLDILQKAYNQGTSFCKIAASTKVSNTTARRIVRGITKPTNNIYKLANNISKDDNIESVLSLNLNKISRQLNKLCEKIGHEKKELCLSAGRCKQLLYGHKTRNIVPLYSLVYDLTRKLFNVSKNLHSDLLLAEKKMKYLSKLLESDLFFDQISFIKKIISNCKYVYDLETEDHNFVANNLLVHNSYTVGVLLEELLESKIPIVVIDPHGEYSTLKYPNDEDKSRLKKLNLKSKGYLNQIQEFSPDIQTNPDCKPLKLSNKNLSSHEIIHMMPAKLSNAQLSILYSALKNLGNKADFDELLLELENEDSSGKWTLINILEYVKKLDLFSDAPTPLFELVKTGKASIINLKGVSPEVQEVVVYKLVKDLFAERKKSNIPPFFLVIEEGHNFIPERTYGEAKSSGILRQIFSEGRKFGLGVCLVSQRPSRVEKNALSQVNTQLILKVTNPNDVKAVSNSVEGITPEAEKEIKNIPIGTALVTGVVDMPIFVNIRPRHSKHGGAAVKILGEEVEEDKDFVSEAKKSKGELLPLIKQKVSLKDLKLMGKKKVKVVLAPCVFLYCSDKQDDFNLLINLSNGHVVTDLESGTGIQLKGFKLESLSPQQKKVMKVAFELKEFKPAEVFSRSGLQFSDLYETIKTLTNKGFFVKSGDKYSLSDELSLFANIQDKTFYGKVEYSSIEFDEQLDKKVDVISLVEFLGRFFEIKNEKECWLVLYN